MLGCFDEYRNKKGIAVQTPKFDVSKRYLETNGLYKVIYSKGVYGAISGTVAVIEAYSTFQEYLPSKRSEQGSVYYIYCKLEGRCEQ